MDKKKNNRKKMRKDYQKPIIEEVDFKKEEAITLVHAQPCAYRGCLYAS